MTQGGCACGAVRYEYHGNPIVSYKCHCSDGQIYSSSGYVALLLAWSHSFSFSLGTPTWRVHSGSSGKEAARGFCSVCGTPVAVRLGVLPLVMAVSASSLDDPLVFVPEHETWTLSARNWDLLSSSIPHFEGNFTGKFIKQRFAGAADA